jgi:hypothetical protein
MNQLEDEISLTIPNFRPYTLHPNLFFLPLIINRDGFDRHQ